MENGKQPLRPKAQGKYLMVSDFLAPGGRLAVPDTASDTEPAVRLLPHRYATEYFEYGMVPLHFLAVRLSLHLKMHPTIALMQLMRSELRT